MNKAFIFSYDAMISLMLIVIFISFTTYYVGSFSYSSFEDYELMRSTDSILKTMIADGTFFSAVQSEQNGNTAQAKASLRQELRRLFGNRHKQKATVEIYDSSMNLVYSIEAYQPQNARISFNEKVIASRQLFSYDDYYGIVKLQVWK